MKKIVLGSILSTIAFFSCETSTITSKDVNISENFSTKTNEFSFDFWKELNKQENKGENYFVSPLSLHIALGMLLNGADNETKSEIQKTLGFENESMDAINATYLELIENLPKVDPKVTNTIANSIWQEKTFTAEADFLNILQKQFKARLFKEDFANKATVSKINQWASDNTNAKVQKILEQIDPNMVMFLINALYFKGDWADEFDSKNTIKTDFYGQNGKKQVDMMQKTAEFKYADLGNYKMAELPYGSGKYAMNIILPNENQDINDLIKTFNFASWEQAKSKLNKSKIILNLPKFKIEYSKKLNSVLQEMGIKKVFTNAADLSKIAKPAGKLVVNFVKQDTFVAVDEKGTEAAAVTTIGIVLTSMPIHPEMICNRPFLFVISESSSKTIQFIGKVANF
jgi:serine protease inhibitor